MAFITDTSVLQLNQHISEVFFYFHQWMHYIFA